MLNWIKKILKKDNSGENCDKCVWHKSEEALGLKSKDNSGYCWINKKYTKNDYYCSSFQEEKFEADELSTSTPELSLDLDLEIERNRLNE